MKKILVLSLLFFSIYEYVTAAEKPETVVSTSSFKIYSGGLSIGAVAALNESMQDVSENFLKISFNNVFAVREYMDIFLDVEWCVPGYNIGAETGVDFYFTNTSFRPFAGFGFGAYHIDHGNDFGDDFGPAASAHAGFKCNMTDNVALRIRIPYRVAINDSRDHSIGLECGFLFSSRFKNIRKLNYK